jgi:hypothetical protein
MRQLRLIEGSNKASQENMKQAISDWLIIAGILKLIIGHEHWQNTNKNQFVKINKVLLGNLLKYPVTGNWMKQERRSNYEHKQQWYNKYNQW